MSIYARLAVFVGVLAFAFLIGAFIALSFNPADWAHEGRLMVAVFGTFVAGMVATFPYDEAGS